MGAHAHRAVAVLGLALGLACAAQTQCAQAQSAEEFYNGRKIQMIVGYEVGNDYDIGARLLARYLSKELPGQPAIVVQNMPQASGVVAANYIYLRAARDGSVIGGISRNLPSQAMMRMANIEADPRKFNWLGATSFPGRVCVASADAPVKAAADIFNTELLTGAAGAGSSTSIVPTVLNRVVGTRFKVVEGYRGAGDILIAIDRGEVHGVCMSLGQFRTSQQKFKEGKLRYLLRAEESPLPGLPDVPSVYDFAKTDEQRQLMRFIFSSTEFGRPLLFPPGVPQDRVQYMRKAIAAAANNPGLIAEAGKMKLDMVYRQPEHLEKVVTQLYETPRATVEKARQISPNLK
jgi:tripartite-type tricarboxylate transporter receptor subunit TctC